MQLADKVFSKEILVHEVENVQNWKRNNTLLLSVQKSHHTHDI